MVDAPAAGQRLNVEVNSHNGPPLIEGVALHPAAQNHVTVKLVNGYNASYPLEDVQSIELLGATDLPDTSAPLAVSTDTACSRDEPQPQLMSVTKIRPSR